MIGVVPDTEIGSTYIPTMQKSTRDEYRFKIASVDALKLIFTLSIMLFTFTDFNHPI